MVIAPYIFLQCHCEPLKGAAISQDELTRLPRCFAPRDDTGIIEFVLDKNRKEEKNVSVQEQDKKATV